MASLYLFYGDMDTVLIVNEEETKMTETKAERYVTYAEFDDFKKHDFQEVRDDIKDIRSDLSEMKGISRC